jgi:hypothetical protein
MSAKSLFLVYTHLKYEATPVMLPGFFLLRASLRRAALQRGSPGWEALERRVWESVEEESGSEFLPPASPFLHDFRNSRFCGGLYFFARTASFPRRFPHFCATLGIHGFAVGCTFLHARLLFAAGFSSFA